MTATIPFKNGHIPILTAGRGWLAVDKPARMSIHNDPGDDLISIVSGFLAATPEAAARLDCDPDFSVAAVHRLDRDTSGVLLLACRAEIFRHFSRQFETRTVKKRYTAILHGHLGKPGDTGEWSQALSPRDGGRNRPAGTGPKTPCKTRYTVIAHSEHYTRIECDPVTGRKHQIRRHAKLAGHPVAGDRRYGSKRAIQFLEQRYAFARLALHAQRLTLRTPEGPGPVTIETPELPGEITRLFAEEEPLS